MYIHNCITGWIGDGSMGNEFRPAFTAHSPNGNYGEPVDNVCHSELATLDPTAIEADINVLVLYSTNTDGSPRINKNDLTTAGQRTAIQNWLQNKGVTTDQLLWMRDRFAEQFGHPWSEATRYEVGRVIRLAVKRRFT